MEATYHMLSFESDYIAGAHPDILRRLAETNLEPLPGYGTDKYCDSAKEKIRALTGRPEAEVFFLAGGTQTNAVVISTMLADDPLSCVALGTGKALDFVDKFGDGQEMDSVFRVKK